MGLFYLIAVNMLRSLPLNPGELNRLIARRMSACVLAMLSLGYLEHPYADALDTHRWESRLVVASAPSLDDPALKQQRAEAEKDVAGWADRRLLLLVVADGKLTGDRPGSGSQGGQILRRLGMGQENFSVVVVGLDGTVKLRRESPVSNQTLYDLIDAMPMRREELKLRTAP